MTKRLLALLALCSLVGTTSCIDEVLAPDDAAAQIELVSGGDQSGRISGTLASPIVVRVRDQSGNAVVGATVTFSPDTGSGTVSLATALTDAEGKASVSWTLGATFGTKTLRVAAGGDLLLAVAATVVPDRLELVSGSNQVVRTSGELPAPVIVQLVDLSGKPAVGVAVTFQPAAGGGTVVPSIVSTGTDGSARVLWTLGAVPGATTMRISAASATSSLTVNATATQDILTLVSGGGQGVRTGVRLPDSVVVKLIDQSGRPVKGVQLTFAPAGGSGTITPQSGFTNDVGEVRGAWTLGTTVGEQTLTVTGGSATPLVVTASGLAAQALTVIKGDQQAGRITSTLPNPVIVRVQDASGRVVPGAAVSFAPVTGSGSVTATSVVTDTKGEAQTTWTLGPDLGVDTLVVTSGTATLRVVATVTQDRATLAAGTGQSGRFGSTLGDLIRVKVTDFADAPVAGASVRFLPATGSGSVSPATVSTDALGEARTAWTLGSTVGTMTLRVVAGTADTLSLTATAIPDTSRRLLIVAGNNQADTLGQTLPTPLRVRVTDAAGNAIAGAEVIWNDSITNGLTVGSAQVRTDANGEATTSARLSVAVGPAVVRARLRDRSESVLFTATAQLPLSNVFAGNFFTCGLGAEGRSYCWGFNDVGQLAKGAGVFETVDRPSTPVTLGDSLAGPYPTFRQLAVGRSHACGVTLARQLLCWGTGNAALGASTPTLITEVNSVASTAAVTAGEIHTCVLDIGGKIRCAGENQRGELGRVTSNDPVLDTLRTGTNPTVLDSISDPLVGFVGGLRYSAVTAGQLHTCAFPRFDPSRDSTQVVDNTMRPLCWGDNTAGQLGNGTTLQRVRPDTVAIFPGVTAYDSTSLVTGAQHTCVLSTAGDAYCWGSNAFGQLGNGGATGTGARQLKMVLVSGGRKFDRLAAGDFHTCGIERVTGDAYCWGRNNVGQLGDGGTTQRATPVKVTRPADATAGQRFIQLSLGEFHSCGVLGTSFGTGTLAPTGTAYCWGDNEYGQLGDGARSGNLAPVLTPKRVIYQP